MAGRRPLRALADDLSALPGPQFPGCHPVPARPAVQRPRRASGVQRAAPAGRGDRASALRALTDLGTITRLLHARVAYKHTLDACHADLDHATASLLRSAMPLLSLATFAVATLRESSSIILLADTISSRVRHLDIADYLIVIVTTAQDFLAIDTWFPTDDDLRRDLLDIKRRLKGLT